MIIFLTGEDTYRLNENRESVIRSYQAKHGSGFNLFRIDGSSNTAGADVAEAIKSVSLFSEVKLVLISNIFSNANTAEEINQLVKKYGVVEDKGIVILATHPGTAAQAKPKELYVTLNNFKNLVRDFENLEGQKLNSWLKKEAALRDATFGPGAMSRFSAIAGSDSWARINNLNKLANYCGKVISLPAVNLLIELDVEPNIFEFIDALGSGRRAEAFALLCKELAHGRDPYYLLTMATYQFRNMLIVKDFAERNVPQAEIAKKAGIHPFVVKKMISATAKLTAADIAKLYKNIVDLEQGTKQGRRDLEDGLFDLALR